MECHAHRRLDACPTRDTGISLRHDYDETEPRLANGRDEEVVVVCRSGLRSVLAAFTLKLMGFSNPVSLKTGMHGWNDYEQPLVDGDEKTVNIDDADEFFESHLH